MSETVVRTEEGAKIFSNHRYKIYDYEIDLKITRSNNLKLTKFLAKNGTRWNARDMGEVLTDAIEYFISNHKINEKDLEFKKQSFYLDIREYEKLEKLVKLIVVKKEEAINMILEEYLEAKINE